METAIFSPWENCVLYEEENCKGREGKNVHFLFLLEDARLGGRHEEKGQSRLHGIKDCGKLFAKGSVLNALLCILRMK